MFLQKIQNLFGGAVDFLEDRFGAFMNLPATTNGKLQQIVGQWLYPKSNTIPIPMI